jgi:hypothetical protein
MYGVAGSSTVGPHGEIANPDVPTMLGRSLFPNMASIPGVSACKQSDVAPQSQASYVGQIPVSTLLE